MRLKVFMAAGPFAGVVGSALENPTNFFCEVTRLGGGRKGGPPGRLDELGQVGRDGLDVKRHVRAPAGARRQAPLPRRGEISYTGGMGAPSPAAIRDRLGQSFA